MNHFKTCLWLVLTLLALPLHADDFSVSWPFDQCGNNAATGTPNQPDVLSYSNVALGNDLPFIHIFDNSQHLTFAEEIVKSCFESCISWT